MPPPSSQAVGATYKAHRTLKAVDRAAPHQIGVAARMLLLLLTAGSVSVSIYLHDELPY